MSKDSPAAILYDEDGNPVQVLWSGGHYILSGADDEVRDTLGQILKQLKLLNAYMAEAHGSTLEDEDVE